MRSSVLSANYTSTYKGLCVCQVASVVSDSATSWTPPCQVPLTTGSPRQEPGLGCRVLLQAIFPIQRLSPRLRPPALAGRCFTSSASTEAPARRWRPLTDSGTRKQPGLGSGPRVHASDISLANHQLTRC